MRSLWLTLADPDPATNGQFLYSSGLIQAAASAGMEVHAVGLGRLGAQHRNGQQRGGIRWWLAEHQGRSKWAALLSGQPQIAMRSKTRLMQRFVRELLAADRWDVIVFDSISVGWALSPVLRRYAPASRRPKLVYLSHNHEERVARNVAKMERKPPKRLIKRFDAFKVARLERALVENADLITAIAPEDRRQFLGAWPRKRVEFLPPGYAGRRVPARRITKDVPRRAIIVGSFDWIAKRVSLEEFLGVADRLFARAGVELCVVGSAEECYLSRLRRNVVATTFTGRVDNVARHMAQARLALVPDRLAGFKLKTLDYIFNRVPILGISGSISGVPLRPNETVLLFPDHETLAEGVLRVIDDFEMLNEMQDLAYAACRDQFDWARIGSSLVSAISLREGLAHETCLLVPLSSTA